MPSKRRRSRSATEFIGTSAGLVRNFQDNLHRLRYGIVVAQLDATLTFCKVAVLTNLLERWDESLVNATNTYEVAKALLDETDLTIPESAIVEERLRQVDELLEQARGRWLPDEADNGQRHHRSPRSYF